MKNIRTHLYVSGTVQRVFFRDGMRRKALELGVTGWVRNLVDGRVEAVLEGYEEPVSTLVKYCHQGSPTSIVDDVTVSYETFVGEFNTFRITD